MFGDCLVKGFVFFYFLGLIGKSGIVLFEVVDKFGCFLSLSFSGFLVLGGVFLCCKILRNDNILNVFSIFDV